MLTLFTFNQKWFMLILFLVVYLLGITSYLMYAALGPTGIIQAKQSRSTTDSNIKPGQFTLAPVDRSGIPNILYRATTDHKLYRWSPFSQDQDNNIVKAPYYGNETPQA